MFGSPNNDWIDSRIVRTYRQSINQFFLLINVSRNNLYESINQSINQNQFILLDYNKILILRSSFNYIMFSIHTQTIFPYFLFHRSFFSFFLTFSSRFLTLFKPFSYPFFGLFKLNLTPTYSADPFYSISSRT